MSESALQNIKKVYKADVVAKCLIKIANDQTDLGVDPDSKNHVSEGITNLKLQKMLFFADAVNLALNDKPLMEEDFEAWSLGPVIKSVYDTYKTRNREPIQLTDNDIHDKDLEAFLTEVWKTFGKYSASELVNLSHELGSPWKRYYDESSPNKIIPKEEIKEYYKRYFRLKNG
jgi:uncharacterized phage-associated protein